MNTKLRREHWERITDGRARQIYDGLCEACEKRPGGLQDADQMMIADVAYSEQIKQMLMDDIKERGIGKERSNGRQRYWQDNKSLAHFRSFCETQRKQLAELRLTPNARKAESIEIDDDFERFPD